MSASVWTSLNTPDLAVCREEQTGHKHSWGTGSLIVLQLHSRKASRETEIIWKIYLYMCVWLQVCSSHRCWISLELKLSEVANPNPTSCFVFQTGSFVAQASLKLSVVMRMTRTPDLPVSTQNYSIIWLSQKKSTIRLVILKTGCHHQQNFS